MKNVWRSGNHFLFCNSVVFMLGSVHNIHTPYGKQSDDFFLRLLCHTYFDIVEMIFQTASFFVDFLSLLFAIAMDAEYIYIFFGLLLAPVSEHSYYVLHPISIRRYRWCEKYPFNSRSKAIPIVRKTKQTKHEKRRKITQRTMWNITAF